MSAGDLTSPENAMAWIGSADSDSDLVQRLISAVSGEIQKWLGYQIATQTYTRTFSGTGGSRLVLPDRPVTGVSAVSIDGVSIPASSTPTQPGFVYDATSVMLRGGYGFFRGIQNVSVTYVAGYAATPADLEQACLDWLNSAWAGRDRDPSIKARSAGDTSESYDGTTRLGSTVVPMPASVLAVLQPYRRMTPV